MTMLAFSAVYFCACVWLVAHRARKVRAQREHIALMKAANAALAENNEELSKLLEVIEKAKERTPGGATGAWPEIKGMRLIK